MREFSVDRVEMVDDVDDVDDTHLHWSLWRFDFSASGGLVSAAGVGVIGVLAGPFIPFLLVDACLLSF